MIAEFKSVAKGDTVSRKWFLISAVLFMALGILISTGVSLTLSWYNAGGPADKVTVEETIVQQERLIQAKQNECYRDDRCSHIDPLTGQWFWKAGLQPKQEGEP